MKALILAAGRGSRLVPLSYSLPKAMVPVNGTPIFVRQVEALRENEIRDIGVVVGYKGDKIKQLVRERYGFVQIIENSVFDTTNNMYSAYLAKDWVGGRAFLMMNGDVVFDSCIIKELLDYEDPNAVCVEQGRYLEESMKVREEQGRLVEISKTIPESVALGVSIDVYKFSSEAGESFFRICADYIQGKRNVNMWSEVAINDLFAIHRFAPCFIGARWSEIDTLDDLRTAEELFSKN